MNRAIFGHVEKVDVPTFGVKDLIAKVDTGAFSGALHCTDIRLDEATGMLSFSPMGDEALRYETAVYEQKIVRSASGHEESRFIIPIELVIQGTSYKTSIGLTDRSDMTREMLIGRRFLREHNILVDVSINEEYDSEWRVIEE